MQPITQLYLSIDAPTKELLKEIDNPLFSDYWERMNKSLEYLAEKKGRTCIRLTMIKDVNMVHPEKYAELINKGQPDFIEVKAYMFLGASTQRLKKENMPIHEEIVSFTKEFIEYLDDYEIVSEHIPSRVVMLAKKKFKKDDGWHTWIDFNKFNSGERETEQYLRKTPEVGLSGKGTLDNKYPKKLFVDEETDEMKFYED